MFLLKLFFFILLFTGCATRGEKFKSKYSFLTKQTLSVEFISQDQYHCAPAALTMVTQYLGHKISLPQITEMLYTPRAKGTFQNDVLAATRRLGLIAIPVKKLKHLIIEINNQNPILIFQNLGLTWLPKWHYALAVGYNFDKNQLILHTGEEKNYPMKMNTFEKIWARVDEWGLIIVKPGNVPETATEEDMVAATAGLELTGHHELAILSYRKTLGKWKESLGALVGLGNIFYKKNELKKSQNYFKQAIEAHPKAAGAWHNYAMVLYADNKLKAAQSAASKAIEYADPPTSVIYKKNLEPILISK